MKRVHKDGSAQITEKKSRFIGDVYNIENEEEVGEDVYSFSL